MNIDTRIDSFIDITNDFCPMTFVKTKLRLKEMAKGEVLEVKLSDGEPLESVPENIIQDGHQVLKIISNGKDSRIFIKKN